MSIDRWRRPARLLLLFGLTAGLALSCDLVRNRRLVGQWRSEARPERTLDLYADQSYRLRFSGKGLGFLSDIVGPERGTWRVENGALTLLRKGEAGDETTVRWPINELGSDQVVLAGDRWQRVREGS